MSKEAIRKQAKAIRSRLDMNKISSELIIKVKNTSEYKNSKNIMIFYPLKDEVNLLDLLNDNSKNFYLPKINGKNLLCCPYKSGDRTCLSCFKTCEPLSEPCSKNQINMVIAPALACDKNNFRLGYGGGFYDRFLRDFNGTKITCIPKELMFETIYPEKHDIALDLVITQ